MNLNDFKNLRYNSYGELVTIEKTPIKEETPTLIEDDDICPFDDDYYDDDNDLSEELYTLVYDALSDYENEITIYSDSNVIITHEPTGKSVELQKNFVDDMFSSFIFTIVLDGKKRFIDNKQYILGGIKDDIFDSFLRELIDKYSLEEKDVLACRKNDYLQLLFPDNLLKTEDFWDKYQAIKKKFGRAHFKDGFIYFDNTRIFVNRNNILYHGYIETDLDAFITNYVSGKYQKINPIFSDAKEFLAILQDA